MTRAVGDDTAMLQSLNEVASLFEKAQNSIFKLMSSVSLSRLKQSAPLTNLLRTLYLNSSNTRNMRHNSEVSTLPLLPHSPPRRLPVRDHSLDNDPLTCPLISCEMAVRA